MSPIAQNLGRRVFPRALVAAMPLLLAMAANEVFAQECSDPGASMLAWFPLDEPGGEMARDAVGGNDAVVVDAAVVAGVAGSGNARRFDALAANGGRFSAEGDAALDLDDDTFTLEGWIRLENNLAHPAQTFTAEIGKQNLPGVQAYAIVFEGGQLAAGTLLDADEWQFEYILTNAAGTRVHNQSTGITVAADGAFHHFALVYDVATVRLYVDGVPRGSFGGFSGPLMSVPARPFEIDGNSPFAADEIAVHGVALSDAQVLALFQDGGQQRCKPCAEPLASQLSWYPGERHIDDHAGFHNGRRINGADFAVGKVGEAMSFDGIDDGVENDVGDGEMHAVANTFTIEFWALPSASRTAGGESAFGTAGQSGQRYAIFPQVANAPRAGIGVSVGNNGVSVVEHAASHTPTVLVFDTPITDWTHVAVVYENRVPTLYLDGEPVRTGTQSAIAEVFASWRDLGTNTEVGGHVGYGAYRGLLDEVTVHDRALDGAELRQIVAAASAGKCRAACVRERADDAWQGALVTSHSGLRSALPDGMFGRADNTPEATSTLFEDGQPAGTVHAIEWETESPISLVGFGLAAFHDDIATTKRAFRNVRIEARAIGGQFAPVYDTAIVVPYGPDSREMDRCVNLRPVRAQQFRALFEQAGPAGLSGPRVLELDGIGLPDDIFSDGFETAP